MMLGQPEGALLPPKTSPKQNAAPRPNKHANDIAACVTLGSDWGEVGIFLGQCQPRGGGQHLDVAKPFARFANAELLAVGLGIVLPSSEQFY